MAKHEHATGEASGPGSIVFFDIDNTLVRGACLYYFGFEAYRHRYISFRDILRFARKNLSFIAVGENPAHLSQVRERALALLKGRSVAGVNRLAAQATQKRVLKQLNQPTVERLQEHLHQGHQIWLATAGPEPLAEELQRHFGVHGNISTRLLTQDGHYTGEINGSVTHAAEKSRQVADIISQSGIDPKECWAYSDSYNDLPMLTLVGHPVAVNPDRALEEHAIKHGWEIIRIRKRENSIKAPLLDTPSE